MKGILKLNKSKAYLSNNAYLTNRHWILKKSDKKKSCPHQLNLNVTGGVLIKHMTVLGQVTTCFNLYNLNKWWMPCSNLPMGASLWSFANQLSPRVMRDDYLVSSLWGIPAVSTSGIWRLTKTWPGTSKSPLPYCNKESEDKKINIRTVN